MSKAVLISIRHEWCEKIASGQKTIEIRKTRPKLDTPFKVYVYQTVPKWGDINDRQGRVFCEFTCDRIIEGIKFEYKHGYYGFGSKMLGTMKASMMMSAQIYDYLKDKTGYGWHISDLVIYDKPKELSEFFMECRRVYCTEKCEHYGADCHVNSVYQKSVRPVKRPPQSWCYVEES